MPEEPADRIEEPLPAPRRAPARRSAADEVRAVQFPAAMRGYDRAAVDAWQDEIAVLVQRLEEQQQPREAAVKRALDEVGQETTGILQRAHDAAEEITSRSRSQADDRLQRAEREADTALREAEERVRELEDDAQMMWERRTRLIEEMRQLADEMLGVADDALERMQPPVTSDSPAIVVVEGEEPDVSRDETGVPGDETDVPRDETDVSGEDPGVPRDETDVSTEETAAIIEEPVGEQPTVEEQLTVEVVAPDAEPDGPGEHDPKPS